MMETVARPSESPAVKGGRNPVEEARVEELRKTLQDPTAIETIRMTNLRKLIAAYGGPAMLARTLEYSNASFVVQMAGPNPMRAVTEKSARIFEQRLRLPMRWLDDPRSEITRRYAEDEVLTVPMDVSTGTRPDAILHDPATNTTIALEAKNFEQSAEIVRLCAKLVEEEKLTDIPLARFASLVELALSDSAEHGGQPRPDHMRKMMRLMK